MKGIVIAGAQSSAGKTTVSMAVIRLLKNSGMDVVPFKVGPDYIDPKFHRFVTGNHSYNLDSWMLDEETVRYLFRKNSAGKDIAVIEGVMGLYDGSGFDSFGSTAHVAKILCAPVVLVLDAHGMSVSAAAMALGYKNYDPGLDLKGVILNRISGRSHYDLLKVAIERDTGLRCFGYLAPDKEFSLGSRHLGLVPVEELGDLERKVDALSELAGKTLDIKGLENISGISSSFEGCPANMNPGDIGRGLRIGIAQDEAFNFYYQDNLNLMKETGVDLCEFSPVHDARLPDNIDGLYLGGGFPEVFAEKLSANIALAKEIRERAENGMPVYAECGGLMYLCSGIIINNNFYPCVDFFKCRVKMTPRLQRFGYVEVMYNGIRTRAHEFHHTVLEDVDDSNFEYAYTVKKANKNEEWKCGLTRRNVLAGYAHVHFYANMDFYRSIISLFRRNRGQAQ